jgi:RNA polymerase sigma-70 factor (ECF subfamily)
VSEFAAAAERYRRELLAHAYRMLGSLDDAEDAVQETYLRAWRGYGDFERRSSMRTWLYRIATNVCLNFTERRRVLPSGLGAPAADAGVAPTADEGVDWLQPVPDALVTPETDDPAAVVAARESLRLALLEAVQVLPPRQRAVLMLREVLGFRANEVAEMLDMSVPAVKSALQRARATMTNKAMTNKAAATNKAAVTNKEESRKDREADQQLLADYIAGFENSDITSLERALRKDAALEVVGSKTWFAGVETCLAYLSTVLGSPGDWRMMPTSINGQPATATWWRGEPFGVAVLTTAGSGISRIVVWGDPELPGRIQTLE